MTKPGLISYTLVADTDGRRSSSEFFSVFIGVFQVGEQNNGSYESPTPFSGSYVGRSFDFELIRTWLEDWSTSHEKCKRSILKADQRVFESTPMIPYVDTKFKTN